MSVSDSEWARIVAAQNDRMRAMGFDPEGEDADILDFDGEADPMTAQEAAGTKIAA